MNKVIALLGLIIVIMLGSVHGQIKDQRQEIATLSSQLLVQRAPGPDGELVTIISSENLKILKQILEEK